MKRFFCQFAICILISANIAGQSSFTLSGGLGLMGGWQADEKNATLLPALQVQPMLQIFHRNDLTVLPPCPG
jgi:hypothetical protein